MLNAISQSAQEAIVVVSRSGLIAHWNKGAEKLFGYAESEAIGKKIYDLIASERYCSKYADVFVGGAIDGEQPEPPYRLEAIAMRRDGEEFPVEISLSCACIDGVWYTIGFLRDITEWCQIVQSLRDNEDQLKAILERVPVGIAIVGENKLIHWVNKTMLNLLGVDDDTTVIGQPSGIFLRDQSRKIPNPDDERKLFNVDGKQVTVLISTSKIRFGGENALLETFVDINALKQVETELSHARKLEAVGQLAAGIAHEINTPTQFVGDSVHFLKEALEDQDRLIHTYQSVFQTLSDASGYSKAQNILKQAEAEADINYIRQNVPGACELSFDGITRITTIVNAMKDFAHVDQREKCPADINQALRNTLTISRNEYKYIAEVATTFDDLPLVVCRIGDLNQVFLNLIVNAAHAIGDVVGNTGEQGLISITTKNEVGKVRIEFTDSGTGIPAAIRDRIFEPFFTTKEVGKGSGQGLTIAHKIIENHGGNIEIFSEMGCGTSFVITLPIMPNDKGDEV